MNDPWKALNVPKSGFYAKKISGAVNSELYRARNSKGDYLGIFYFPARKNRVNIDNLNNLKIDFFPDHDGKSSLIFTLGKRELFSIFDTLLLDLDKAIISDKDDSVTTVKDRINRWRVIFQKEISHKLSENTLQGIFGELSFLNECAVKYKIENTIHLWHGPEGHNQDFVIGNNTIEIKTVSTSKASYCTISSEKQLESHQDNLYLKVFVVSKTPDKSGLTVPELVNDIEHKIMNSKPDLLQPFYAKLSEIGYFYDSNYDNIRFLVVDAFEYLVDKEFPSITSRKLPTGITDVSYRLSLNDIEPFLLADHIIEVIDHE